jgi:hypothetical protein
MKKHMNVLFLLWLIPLSIAGYFLFMQTLKEVFPGFSDLIRTLFSDNDFFAVAGYYFWRGCLYLFIPGLIYNIIVWILFYRQDQEQKDRQKKKLVRNTVLYISNLPVSILFALAGMALVDI